MKYLGVLTLLVFFLAASTSTYGQGTGDCLAWSVEEGYHWVDCPSTPPADETDMDEEAAADNGGSTNPKACTTISTIISEMTFPCGSGFVTEIIWQLSCSSGNSGTCTYGTYTEYIGCVDGELPDESAPNLTTINCD